MLSPKDSWLTPICSERKRVSPPMRAAITWSMEGPPAPRPVKDVPEPTELRPVIRTLRVRAVGRTGAALRSWVEDLRRELNAAPYPVPVEA